ncbi:MAG: amidase domain-containing protein [Erysipelotrichaceae bacterium]|nr:amidase domain-containing protein [Erysipelotrichaceae bacterium]
MTTAVINWNYIEFKNQESALETFAKENQSFLKYYSEKYELTKMSTGNFTSYYLLIKNDMLSGSFVAGTVTEYRTALRFFDIFENKEQNEDIRNTIARSKSTGEDITEYLAYELPNFNQFVKDYFEENGQKAVTSFSVSTANTYAITYATSANSSTYGYISGGDCANFCSQILIAGGETMVDNFPNIYAGWWHHNVLGSHTYSRSWTWADKFVRYHQYSSFQTTSYSTFTRWLAPGCFIGYEDDQDGEWDHVAYVTTVDSYKTSGYYDHKIAQHSNDYYKWASNSGWPAKENGDNVFIIIRGARSSPQP